MEDNLLLFEGMEEGEREGRKKVDNSEWVDKLGRPSKEEMVKKAREYDEEVLTESTKEMTGEAQSKLKLFDRLQMTEEILIKSGELIREPIRNSKGDVVGYENKTSLKNLFANGIKNSGIFEGRGRPKKLTPEELTAHAWNFFHMIDFTKEKASIPKFCAYIGIDARTFRNYMSSSDLEYNTVANIINNTMVATLVEGSPIKDIMELKNNHGYKDKSEQTVKIENALDQLTDEELDNKITNLTLNEEGIYE